MAKLSRRFSRPSASLVVAVIALTIGLAGGAYAAKKIGTKQLVKRERAQGFSTRQPSNLALPASTETTVSSLRLPGGRFQVTASVALGGGSAAVNPIRCRLRDDGVELAGGDGFTEIAAFSDTITLVAFSDGGTVTLACSPAINSTARDRVIAAMRVARVQVQ